MMIDIFVTDGKSGYDVIADYVRRYWEYNTYTNIIVSMATSYDNKKYYYHNEVVSPYNYDGIEWLNDWWEGEIYIKLYGIADINDFEIHGGLYE